MKKRTPPSPYVLRIIARAKINNVKLYLKKYCLRADNDTVLFYEVKASDGSYFKTTSEASAQERFERLKEFEKKQLTI